MGEIYVSTDVEVDGPIPGPHSMLSLGSAAFLADKTLAGTFSANLEQLPNASGLPETMAWWARHPEAWEACRHNTQTPATAMTAYLGWLDSLSGKPVFDGYPAAFDFMFVYWYLMSFTGRSPFSFAALDIKTMAMVVLKLEYRASTKRNMPECRFDESPHTYVALDVALEQGRLFCNILAEIRC